MNDERFPWPMRIFDVAIQGVVGGLILLVGMLLTPPRSRWTEGGLIVLVAVIISVGTAIIVNRSYLRFMHRIVADRLAQVTKTALLRGAGVGELVTKEVLSALERTMPVETIWIVCQDFGDDIDPDAPFLEVIKHNVERGVSYRYITPEGDKPPWQVARLRNALGIGADDERVKLVPLTDEQWSRLPYTAGNVTLYDPVASKNPTEYRSPQGVFWYPGGDGDSFGWLGVDIVGQWAARIAGICDAAEGTPPTIGEGPGTDRGDG